MIGKLGHRCLSRNGGSLPAHGQLVWSQVQRGALVCIEALTSQLAANLGAPNNCALCRWERFAPGPVRAVTVAPDKPCKGPKAAPKKRGRKRKNEDEQQADGEGNNAALFQDQEGVAGVAVPAVTEGPDIAAAAEAVPEPAPVQDLTAKFPTRATFAGRAKTGTEDAQAMFDNRRTAFYQGTPEHSGRTRLNESFGKLAQNQTQPLTCLLL